MLLYTNGCSHTDDLPYTARYDVDHKNTFAWPVKLMDKLSNDYKYIRNLNELNDSKKLHKIFFYYYVNILMSTTKSIIQKDSGIC